MSSSSEPSPPSVSRLRGLFESSSSAATGKRKPPQTPYDFHSSSFFPATSPSPPATQKHTAFRPFASRRPAEQPLKLHKKQNSSSPSPLLRSTTELEHTYRTVTPDVQIMTPAVVNKPRDRTLTRDLSKPFSNNDYDNKHSDLILRQGDYLCSSQGQHRFKILELLGQGTFGQVVKCQADWYDRPRMVAVKVVKNKPAYHNQAKVEIRVLQKIQDYGEAKDNIINLLHDFEYHSHLCLVFELLSVNLYEYIKSQEFRGFTLDLVSKFTLQLLEALDALNRLKIIHCDLKPENILLENFNFTRIKLIDLGSSCYQDSVSFAYIQSRFYRAPEILFGPVKKYTSQIDLWSLGCVVIELFQGLPVFPGCSQHNQVLRMVEMCGMPPNWMLATAQEFETDPRKRFFTKVGSREWRLKSSEEFAYDCGLQEVDKTKRYVKERTLEGVIMRCEDKRRPRNERVADLPPRDLECLVDFCQGVLQMDPNVRWTAAQAKQHPFVTGAKFMGPFVPDLQEEEEEISALEDDFEMEEEVTRTRTKPMAIHRDTGNRPLAKRKLSEVGSPFLSSVHQSPIFRPDGIRPLSESWTSPRALGTKFMSHLPNMLLPSTAGASAAATSPRERRVDFRTRTSPHQASPGGPAVAWKSSSLQEQPILVGDPQPPPAAQKPNQCVEKSMASWAPFDRDAQQ